MASVAMFIPGGQPIAAVASVVAVAANVGAQITAKAPPARGSVNGITIGGDQPMPYPMGRTYYGGSRQYQLGYGPTLDKVPNPYAFIVDVYSGVTIAGFQALYADFVSLGIPAAGGAATGYAAGFLWADTQRGLVPEPDALQPRYAGAPQWGADYKLSGEAAIGWSLLFDRKGKVFASGVPQLGAVLQGVMAYDPRADSTYPGGSGPQRINDETTWTYTENPGLHALSYALGRYQQGYKVAGVGIEPDGLLIADFVHLANVCEANGWKVGGVIFEPAIGSASTRWQNLKDILAAGGAEPCFRNGQLGLKVSAPRVALDTITGDDLADGDIVVGGMQGYEARLNTLIPKYRSEPHKWEYVQSTQPISIASYVAEDGEVKREERQFNLVQQKDQAAQLCAYELIDRRELGEIEVPCKPRMRRYGPGDLLIVDLPEAGLPATPCVILKKTVDPVTMTVSFVLRGETPAKHSFALAATGAAPPTPALGGTEALDAVAAPIDPNRAAYQIAAQSIAYPVTSTDTTITIQAFRATLDDGRIIDFPAGSITGLTAANSYVVLWDLAAQAYMAVLSPALNEIASSAYAIIRYAVTQETDGTYPDNPTPPGGDGGGGYGGSRQPVAQN